MAHHILYGLWQSPGLFFSLLSLLSKWKTTTTTTKSSNYLLCTNSRTWFVIHVITEWLEKHFKFSLEWLAELELDKPKRWPRNIVNGRLWERHRQLPSFLHLMHAGKNSGPPVTSVQHKLRYNTNGWLMSWTDTTGSVITFITTSITVIRISVIQNLHHHHPPLRVTTLYLRLLPPPPSSISSVTQWWLASPLWPPPASSFSVVSQMMSVLIS